MNLYPERDTCADEGEKLHPLYEGAKDIVFGAEPCKDDEISADCREDLVDAIRNLMAKEKDKKEKPSHATAAIDTSKRITRAIMQGKMKDAADLIGSLQRMEAHLVQSVRSARAVSSMELVTEGARLWQEVVRIRLTAEMRFQEAVNRKALWELYDMGSMMEILCGMEGTDSHDIVVRFEDDSIVTLPMLDVGADLSDPFARKDEHKANAHGSDGQMLSTDGTGNLSWGTFSLSGDGVGNYKMTELKPEDIGSVGLVAPVNVEDTGYLKVLDELQQKGVPVPIRVWTNAAGFDLDAASKEYVEKNYIYNEQTCSSWNPHGDTLADLSAEGLTLYRHLGCEHDPVNTGMKTSWCRKCDADMILDSSNGYILK